MPTETPDLNTPILPPHAQPAKRPHMSLVIIGAAIFIPLFILALILGATGMMGDTGNNNGSNQSTTSGTTVSLGQQPIPLPDYNYAGIRDNDTLIFVDTEAPAIVINLDQLQWRDLQWSPDGKLLAVLGNTHSDPKNPVYNLFIFDPQVNKWRQATDYQAATSTTGISGFGWWSNNLLTYTKIDGGAVWLHNYDYQNQQISKLFTVPGKLQQVVAGKKYLLVEQAAERSDVYHVIAANQKLEKTFLASELASGATFVDVKFGNTENDFLLTIRNATAYSSFSWSLSSLDYVPIREYIVSGIPGDSILPLDPENNLAVCAHSSEHVSFLRFSNTITTPEINLINLISHRMDKLIKLDYQPVQAQTKFLRTQCQLDESLMSITHPAVKYKWYSVKLDKVTELNAMEGLVEVARK